MEMQENNDTRMYNLYIQEEFRQRRCCYYIEDKQKPSWCECGRKDIWHGKDLGMDQTGDTGQESGPWSPETHSKLVDPDAFGSLVFVEDHMRSKTSTKYIRVSHDTSPEKIVKLFKDHWSPSAPKLLISIMGNTEHLFKDNRAIKRLFQQNFNEVLDDTEAWIVTDGVSFKTRDVIGHQRSHGDRITGSESSGCVCIGIGQWGSVYHKETLGGCKEGKQGIIYEIKEDSDNLGTDLSLRGNHSHLVLLDDGTSGKRTSRVAEARLRIEEAIAQEYSIPRILLVMGGDGHDLSHVTQVMSPSLPLVIVADSGHAADFIKLAIKPSVTNIQMQSVAAQWFREKFSTVDVDFFLEKIEKHKDQITVLNFDEESDKNEIYSKLITAFLKKIKEHPAKQMDLALLWNTALVLEIALYHMEISEHWQTEDKHNGLFHAIVHNNADMVRLFLRSGISLTTFLTKKRLAMLYQLVMKEKASMTKPFRLHMLEAIESLGVNTDPLEDLGIMLKLVRRVIFVLQRNKLEKALTGLTYKKAVAGEADKDLESPVDRPEKELFLYACLVQSEDLALLFWSICDENIGAALTARSMLKKLAKYAQGYSQNTTAAQTIGLSEKFEALASKVLEECYKQKRSTTYELLTRELRNWDHHTVYDIAELDSLKEFIGQPACQVMIARVWKAEMFIHTPIWKIYLVLLCPFFLTILSFSEYSYKINKQMKSTNSKVFGFGYKNRNGAGANLLPKEQKKRQGCCITWLKRLGGFYRAPVTKYIMHSMTYLAFLLIFVFFVLTDLKPMTKESYPGVLEWIVLVWNITYMLEEFRQVLVMRSNQLRYKLSAYLRSDWNKLDTIGHMLYVLAIILRFSLKEAVFYWARIFYVLALTTYIVKVLQAFLVSKQLGPKIIMIRRMLTDLFFFLAVLAVAMAAYGVASYSLRFPNSEPSLQLIFSVIHESYWQIHGELYPEELDDYKSYNVSGFFNIITSPKLVQSNMIIGMSAVYLLLTNVLMFNLLIAVFSDTYRKVQDNSDTIWKFYWYTMVSEYVDRPVVPPPLIVFNHLFRLVKLIWKTAAEKTALRQPLEADYHEELSQFEREAAQTVLRNI